MSRLRSAGTSLSRLAVAALTLGAIAPVMAARAQPPQRVSRAEVVAQAVSRGSRLAIARADSTFARAMLGLARQYENPAFGLSYTKDTPQHHMGLDLPLDLPWMRTPRIGSARFSLDAATHRYAFEREAVVFDADTTYTRALATAARSRITKRTATDADSLLTLARVRRDAGDGSELDVQLALVNAGQLANQAAIDSLEAITALLVVQGVMGIQADQPVIVLSDTLDSGPFGPAAAVTAAGPAVQGDPLLVAAAEAQVKASELALALERRRLFGTPALSLGFDTRDPGGQENALLPVIGFALPIPMFNQNSAAVQAAQAQRDRAAAEFALTRIEVNAALARARRSFTLAQERVSRSQRLLAGANRLAQLSLLGYREGALALPNVLEAQRTANDALAQYVGDVAAARNAAGLVRLLSLTANRPDK